MQNITHQIIAGTAFIVGDNIDTDQIIPAQYLNLVPTIPEEYKKLGSYALSGLPADHQPLVPAGKQDSPHTIVLAGRNFGCGSSREHAPIALGAAGIRAVVAESYARIFFRNAIATGELFPCEMQDAGWRQFCNTGDVMELDLNRHILKNITAKRQFSLKPLGDVAPVVAAGGIFAYARQTGMLTTNGM